MRRRNKCLLDGGGQPVGGARLAAGKKNLLVYILREKYEEMTKRI